MQSAQLQGLSVPELLSLLRNRDIIIRNNCGHLAVNAPSGALDEVLRAELKRRKIEILAALDKAAVCSCPPLERVERSKPIPVTFAQERLWLVNKFQPDDISYNIPQAFSMEGPVHVGILQTAVHLLVKRHETLRTCIEEVNGKPFQRVVPDLRIPVSFTDLTEFSAEDRDQALSELLQKEARHRFILSEPPLIRFHLFRTEVARHVLFFNIHHIVADAWSLGILRKELIALYESTLKGESAHLPELPIQYADYSVWEKGYLSEQLVRERVQYWRKKLAGAPSFIEYPFARALSGPGDTQSKTRTFTVSQETAHGLVRLGRTEGASNVMVWLAAFAVLLYRCSGMQDFCILSPVTGRRFVETQRLIGMFVNMLVIRCQPEDHLSFRDFLRQIRETTLEAHANGDLPFQKLITELKLPRDSGRKPFSQIILYLDKAEDTYPLAPMDIDSGAAKFDFNLHVREFAGGFSASFEYSTSLFSDSDIEVLGTSFVALLEDVSQYPERLISRLNILTRSDQNRIFGQRNPANADFFVNSTLQHLFEQSVQQFPNATAIIFDQEEISYEELNRRANRVAHYLRQQGAEPDVLVGVCLERSIEMIVVLLGILKAGASYVPLESSYPKRRIHSILENCRASLLITRTQFLPEFSLSGLRIVNLEEARGVIASMPIRNPTVSSSSNNLAYVLHLPAQDGTLLSVGVEHRSLSSFLYWATKSYSAEVLQGVLASSSICLGLSIFEIFAPLCCGGAVVLAEDLLELPDLPAAERVTLVNTVPGMIPALIAAQAIPTSVGTVNLSGELASSLLVRQLYEIGSIKQVFDLYGTAETATYSTRALRKPDDPANIGCPIENTQIYILDKNLQPVPIGITGEVFVGGEGIARGYLGNPKLTAERFFSIPQLPELGRVFRTGDLGRFRADGSMELLGRKDRQIKLRGYRIDPGEIEFLLRNFAGIDDVMVSIDEETWPEKRLMAVVQSRTHGTIEAGEVLRFMKSHLPLPMCPVHIAIGGFLPPSNGKLNRLASCKPSRHPRHDSIKNRFSSAITPLKTHGKGPSLFFVCTTTGDLLKYSRLGYYLDTDQPLYGISLHSNGLKRNSTEQLAASLIQKLRDFQPSGPYFLCGSDYGGLIAFEMARLLSSEGLTVALLSLLEPEISAHGKPTAFSKNLNIGGRLNRMFGKSNPFASKILLFLSEELARERNSDPFRWRIDSAASELEMHEVAGMKGSLLREPQVAAVAEKLRNSLHQSPSRELESR